MKITRQKVFETNSSSTHSISLSNKNEFLDTLYPYPDGTLVFEGMTCYQGFNTSDTLEKCNYYLTGILTQYDYSTTRKYLQTFKKIMQEHTGASRIIIDVEIDQQYVEDFSEGSDVTKYSEDDLKNFLFNKQSTVEIKDRDYNYY